MSKLNHFESDMLEEIAKYNSAGYPCLHDLVRDLDVKSREKTSVGLYVNFEKRRIDGVDTSQEATLSSNQILVTSKLNNGLGFVLDIKNGCVNYLEIFTYDEEWNGSVEDYSFESII